MLLSVEGGGQGSSSSGLHACLLSRSAGAVCAVSQSLPSQVEELGLVTGSLEFGLHRT